MSEKINETRAWLENIIIGMNLCPFAKEPFDDGKVKIDLVKFDEVDERFRESLIELNENTFETSLMILDEEMDFEQLLGLVQEFEDGLESVQLDRVFQLIAFHPQFQFEGLEINDRANLVNRSPYPLIHILKSQSIENLNLEPNQGKEISLKNEKELSKLSKEKIEELFPWSNND